MAQGAAPDVHLDLAVEWYVGEQADTPGGPATTWPESSGAEARTWFPNLLEDCVVHSSATTRSAVPRIVMLGIPASAQIMAAKRWLGDQSSTAANER